MNESNLSANPSGDVRQETSAALFANLVAQQTNMAFMFLGRVPHPETGEMVEDIETAKFFIDQLEMLEVKTNGNLDKQEENLLKQSLAGLRLAFVEAVNGDEKKSPPEKSVPPAATPTTEPAPSASASAEPKPLAPEEDSRKKFSKKY